MIAEFPRLISNWLQSQPSDNLPWSDQVCHRKHNTENYAESSDYDVCNTKEVILSSDDSPCRDEQALGTTVFVDWEVWQH